MTKEEELIKEMSSVLKIHKEYMEAYNHKLAIGFNVFNFFDVGENKTSEILAYFLNPKEKHAQGDVFLDSFLKLLPENVKTNNELRNAKVKCEYTIDNNRRIDI